MTIPTGVYGIFTTAGTRVGRAANEIHDVRPKPVFANTDSQDAVWAAEKLPNGNYILHAQAAPTADENGDVVALIIDQVRSTEWRVEHVRGDLFRIEKAGTGLVWTCLSFNPGAKVEVRPPVDNEDIQLFKIVPVN